MAEAKRDNNRVTTLLGVSNIDQSTPVTLWADPSTHALLISGTISVDTTGLATSAKQDTGNTSLASIDTKTPSLGQALAAASVPVVLTAAQISTLTPLSSVTVTQATASNLNATVIGTGTFATQATLQTQTDTVMVGGINIKEINAVTPLMGNGVTGTGSLRVTIASDNTAFSVNSTLSAETTKVIGTVRNADGAGNLWTSNSSTFTAKFAQDVNILGTLGTAFSTAGKVDIKAADGDVFVRSNAASTFPTQATLQTQTDTVMVGGINVKEINAVTPLMGNGVTGTGSLRVTIASNNSAVVGMGVGATGSAVPANASYNGGNASTALASAATAGNTVGAMYDKYGRQVVLVGSIRDLTGTQTTTISASTSETTIVTAAASTFNDLVMLIVSNTSASTNTRIDFRDTTAGSVLFSLFSVGGAAPVGFALPVPIPQTTVNTNWTAQCATSTTDIRIYAVFVKNK